MYVASGFSLGVFKIPLQSFETLTMVCQGVYLFKFILLRALELLRHAD